MACKIANIKKKLDNLLSSITSDVGNKELAVSLIKHSANNAITNKWAESVLSGATASDTLASMKSVELIKELQNVDTLRINPDLAPRDIPKGNNVWGQRVSVDQAKSLPGYSPVLNFGNPFMTGDYANTPLEYETASGSNELATTQYYFWLTEGTIPGAYKGDTKLLDERRSWILNNLALVNNADSIVYKGTAAGKQINHVTALIKVAEDKLGKVERVKPPKTDSNVAPTYEVSTNGDKRFSALVAKLKDGRTIEEAFQLDVKGYRSKGNDWRLGKGKPPLDKSLNLQDEYTKLWQQFFEENPKLFAEISGIVESGTLLTDQFAGKGVNQADTIAGIVNSNWIPNEVVVEDTQVPWHDDSVAEAMTVGKEGRRKVGKVTTVDGEVIEIWKVPTEELTKPDGTELAAVYNSSAKTGGKAAIYLNDSKKLWDEYFTDKNWTKPRVQKDGSAAKAIRENAFNSIKELRDFVIQHEIAHNTLGKRTKDLTIGEYETNVNNEAARVMGIELYDDLVEDTTPPFDVDVPVNPTSRQSIDDITPPWDVEDTSDTTGSIPATVSQNEATQEEFTPYDLPKGKANRDQTIAIDVIKDWYSKGSEQPTFLLKGRGGTGKTTIANKVLEELGMSPDQVVLATPTNKAKVVIRKANAESKYARSEYKTVAGLLNYKETKDKNGNSTFVRMTENVIPPEDKLEGVKVLVIDEVSMLNSVQKKELEQVAMNTGIKIIYMGDNVQLPPVNDIVNGVPLEESTVFTELTEEGVNRATLSERMRQGEESPILSITDDLAAAVENRTSIQLDLSVANGKDVEVSTKSQSDNIKQFIEEYSKDPAGTRWIWFNNAANDVTKRIVSTIRTALYGEDAAKKQIVKNEQVYVGEGFTFEDPATGASIELYNGMEAVVTDVNYNGTLKTVYGNKSIGKHKVEMPVMYVSMKDNLTDTYYEAVPVITEDTRKFINKLKADNPTHGNSPLALYYEALNDITFAGVINTHKSQGSTYQTVFADVGNVTGQYYVNEITKAKALYVATSRPKKRLVLMNVPNNVIKGQVQPMPNPTGALNGITTLDDINVDDEIFYDSNEFTPQETYIPEDYGTISDPGYSNDTQQEAEAIANKCRN